MDMSGDDITTPEHPHVWEKTEIVLHSQRSYGSPYTDVEVWMDLTGPGYEGRVYGFWDGDDAFRVRFVATSPGRWSWVSGSNQQDPGLTGRRGSFEARAWSNDEKSENPCRRGFLRPTANSRALEYADGTPCYLIGDTWWSLPTYRYQWIDDDVERPIGPDMGFKDMVRFRKRQGYNCIATIAAFPSWADDGLPPEVRIDDGANTCLRDAWPHPSSGSAKDMHNEGGRPFLFPGKVAGYEDVYPDVDRINPAYFQHMDRKIDYLNGNGFVAFIEALRRDASQPWERFHDWPESNVRYVHNLWSRYQANSCIFSPIHFDCGYGSISSRAFNDIANRLREKGLPPFGALVSCNSHGSSLVNFGNNDEAPWLTLHQIGNLRDHNSHWLLTDIHNESDPPKPAMNGEPYYVGYPPGTPIKPETEEADLYARSGMYGSFLSGGLAGHIYGAVGLWGGDVHPDADYTMWDALPWRSGDQMRHLRTFVFSEGTRYRDLVPIADLVYPNKTSETTGNRGWAYCARTPERDLFMLHFEADCRAASVRGTLFEREYAATWFDPRTGEWIDAGTLESGHMCEISLPPFPDGDDPSSTDWAMKLVLTE